MLFMYMSMLLTYPPGYSPINEELTKTDKKEIKTLISKELDKVLKSEVKKILEDGAISFKTCSVHICQIDGYDRHSCLLRVQTCLSNP